MGTVEDFYIKQHDLQPNYVCVINDSSGNPVGISGATIRMTMIGADGTVVTSRQTTGISITSADGGLFQYAWQASDTQHVGRHSIEFEVTPSSGGKFTVPANPQEKAWVIVLDDLDGV